MFANSAGQSRTSFLAIYVSAANSKITLERRENRDKKRGLIFTRITASLMARTNRVSRDFGTSNENRVARYSSYVRKQTRVGVEGMAPSAKSVLIPQITDDTYSFAVRIIQIIARIMTCGKFQADTHNSDKRVSDSS